MINIDRSFFDEEEEVPIKEYPNEKSILPLLEDSFKRKKTMKEKTFLKKIKEEERKDSKQDSGVYNKWYMPANQRFIIKRRGKILDSKRSSLMNNG